jgi:hypothetical protein
MARTHQVHVYVSGFRSESFASRSEIQDRFRPAKPFIPRWWQSHALAG